MAFPAGKVPSTLPVKTDFIHPDEHVRNGENVLVDYEYGGVAIQNPNLGFWYQIWRLWVENDEVRLAPKDDPAAAQVLFTAPNIREITFTFDSNMNPVVAYIQAGESKLYWYDLTQSPPGFVTTTVAGVNGSPLLTFDDKRQRMIGAADVMLFYIVGEIVKVRLLRDRFGVEYDWAPLPKGAERVISAGMNEGNRLQLAFSTKLFAPPFLWRLDDPEASYTRLDFGDLNGNNATISSTTDRLYVTTDGGFAEFAAGEEALPYEWWSGARFFRPTVAFAACAVDARGDGDIEIYADGTLRAAQPFSGRTWFRLPPGRPALRWSVRLRGTAVVRKVELGMSFDELKGA